MHDEIQPLTRTNNFAKMQKKDARWKKTLSHFGDGDRMDGGDSYRAIGGKMIMSNCQIRLDKFTFPHRGMCFITGLS
jgi:hypothetical protein